MSESAKRFFSLCQKVIDMENEAQLLREQCYKMWQEELADQDFDDVYDIAGRAGV